MGQFGSSFESKKQKNNSVNALSLETGPLKTLFVPAPSRNSNLSHTSNVSHTVQLGQSLQRISDITSKRESDKKGQSSDIKDNLSQQSSEENKNQRGSRTSIENISTVIEDNNTTNMEEDGKTESFSTTSTGATQKKTKNKKPKDRGDVTD